MKQGLKILAFGISPFSNTPCVSFKLPQAHPYSGGYCVTPTEESGLPIKPPCLYGME